MSHWLQPGFTQEIKRSYICPLPPPHPPQDRVSLCCLHFLRITTITVLRHFFHFSSAKGTTDRTNRLLLHDSRYLHNFRMSITKSSKLGRLFHTSWGNVSLSLPFPADLNAEALLSCTTNTTCLKIFVQSRCIFINMNSDVVSKIHPSSF